MIILQVSSVISILTDGGNDPQPEKKYEIDLKTVETQTTTLTTSDIGVQINQGTDVVGTRNVRLKDIGIGTDNVEPDIGTNIAGFLKYNLISRKLPYTSERRDMNFLKAVDREAVDFLSSHFPDISAAYWAEFSKNNQLGYIGISLRNQWDFNNNLELGFKKTDLHYKGQRTFDTETKMIEEFNQMKSDGLSFEISEFRRLCEDHPPFYTAFKPNEVQSIVFVIINLNHSK